jgi:RNA polymerase sigma-70 factor (ECF subfamily)
LNNKELDCFLAGIERRAYRMALLATRQPADALDVVQDAMTALVAHYRRHPATDWPLLFHRILQNRIMEWHRTRQRASRWLTGWISREDDEEDPLQNVPDHQPGDPQRLLSASSDLERVMSALESLPVRQQQAFLLRHWEGLDVAATAAAMGCSDGAVKTHLFRAVTALRHTLEEPTP